MEYNAFRLLVTFGSVAYAHVVSREFMMDFGCRKCNHMMPTCGAQYRPQHYFYISINDTIDLMRTNKPYPIMRVV